MMSLSFYPHPENINWLYGDGCSGVSIITKVASWMRNVLVCESISEAKVTYAQVQLTIKGGL